MDNIITRTDTRILLYKGGIQIGGYKQGDCKGDVMRSKALPKWIQAAIHNCKHVRILHVALRNGDPVVFGQIVTAVN